MTTNMGLKTGRQTAMRCLLQTASFGALLLAQPAFAQVNPAPAPQDEEPIQEDVIVTGSQVARSGFDTPTPVTVLGIADIERVGAPNIADALNQLPALKPSITPQATTNLSKLAGGNYLDLRGLSYLRTLTLIDGKRYVPATPEGVVNINEIPQAVIGSVEVVTGGASAAYGSDAVAGVVNFKLDHKLQGVRGSAQYGVSDYGDNENYLGSFAFGTKFGGGRGHLLVGGEIAENKGIPRVDSRPWGTSSVINNPAYTTTNAEPLYLLVSDARTSNSSYGGVINSATGTNGTALLRGISFLPGGATTPFNYGTLTTATTQSGGSGVANTGDAVLAQPYKRWAAFGGAEFEFAPAATGYASFSYSRSELNGGPSITGNDQIVIQRDNVFIPTAVKTVLAANPTITNFTMGRSLIDYARGHFDQFAWSWQAIAGLKGDISDNWSYDVSYGYGKSRNNTIFADSRITAKWLAAVDAVDNPATAVVDPICRSTITNPGNGCIPLNLFGVIAPGDQAAAIASITGPSVRDWNQRQQTADIIIRGQPFSLPAGPVGIAAGVHWRKFEVDVLSDPLSASRPGGATVFRVGNTIPFVGEETVKEAFGEAVIPLIADKAYVKRLELDLAGRITDYKTSGQVETWKVGLNYSMNDALRFRATRSRDIRAPNIQELFAAGQTLLFNVNDSVRNETYLVNTTQGGNPGLLPEKADTLTAGVVVTPAPRLSFSIDYYNIKIAGAIAALTAGQIVNRCINGDAAFCQLATREASTAGTTPGRFVAIRLAPANFQSIKTQGVDFEASYNFPLWNGTADLRQLVTYVNQLDLVGDGGVTTELAGNLAQPLIDGINGTSHIRTSTVLGFRNDQFRLNLTGRYVSGGIVTRDIVAAKPTVPITTPLYGDGRFYVDISGEFTVFRVGNEGKVALFGSVLNALNTSPPITGYDGYGAPRQLFDLIGRQFTGGLRFNF